jgi:hypothetical protein
MKIEAAVIHGPQDKYQKWAGTGKPLVRGNSWHKYWAGTKILLVQTHCWYRETIGAKELLVLQ